MHNKIIGYTRDISARYSDFFSPRLVIFNGAQPQRYQIPETGMFSTVEYIGLFLGIAVFIAKRAQKPLNFLPLLLLLIAPVPSALTFEAEPNFQRAIFLYPVWQIIMSYGIFEVIFKKSNQRYRFVNYLLIVVVSFSVLLSTFYFEHQYFVHQPKRTDIVWSRHPEMENLAKFLFENREKKILISEKGGTYIYYLFFNSLNIFNLRVDRPSKYFSGSYSIENIKFTENDCLNSTDLLKEKYDLLIFSPKCKFPYWFTKLKEFQEISGSTPFVANIPNVKIYENFILQSKQKKSLNEDLPNVNVEDTFINFTEN
jgi:hypothetical protein